MTIFVERELSKITLDDVVLGKARGVTKVAFIVFVDSNSHDD